MSGSVPPPPPPPPPPGSGPYGSAVPGGASSGQAGTPIGQPHVPSGPPSAAGVRSGLALAAMIVGVAGLVLCFTVVPSIVAVVLGLVAAKQIHDSHGLLGGLAAARVGWITGIVGVVAGVGFIVLAVAGAFDDGEVAVFDLDEGDCVDLPVDTGIVEIDRVTVVDCDDPHTGQVFRVGQLNPDGDRPYPDDDTLFTELFFDRCTADRYLAWTDRPEIDVDFYPIAPDEPTWESFEGRYVCIALWADGRRATGSLVDGG